MCPPKIADEPVDSPNLQITVPLDRSVYSVVGHTLEALDGEPLTLREFFELEYQTQLASRIAEPSQHFTGDPNTVQKQTISFLQGKLKLFAVLISEDGMPSGVQSPITRPDQIFDFVEAEDGSPVVNLKHQPGKSLTEWIETTRETYPDMTHTRPTEWVVLIMFFRQQDWNNLQFNNIQSDTHNSLMDFLSEFLTSPEPNLSRQRMWIFGEFPLNIHLTKTTQPESTQVSIRCDLEIEVGEFIVTRDNQQELLRWIQQHANNPTYGMYHKDPDRYGLYRKFYLNTVTMPAAELAALPNPTE